MDKWEYLSIFLEAEAKSNEIKDYIQQTFDKKPKRHSPEAMIPDLNKLGSEGWELVHMEPVPRVGRQENVRFDPYRWTNTFFCVFKRLTSQAELQPAETMPAAQTAPEDAEVETPPIQLDPNRIPY